MDVSVSCKSLGGKTPESTASGCQSYVPSTVPKSPVFLAIAMR